MALYGTQCITTALFEKLLRVMEKPSSIKSDILREKIAERMSLLAIEKANCAHFDVCMPASRVIFQAVNEAEELGKRLDLNPDQRLIPYTEQLYRLLSVGACVCCGLFRAS